MTRNDFLRELEECLITLPKHEREAAVRFYAEYFDDAGEGREQDVIAELGKPYSLAMAIIGGTSTYSMSKTNLDGLSAAEDTVDPLRIFDNTEEPEEIFPHRAAPKEIYPNRSVPAEIMPEPAVRQEKSSVPDNYRVRLVVLMSCILTVVVMITIAVVAFTSGKDNVAIERPAAPTAPAAPAVTTVTEVTITGITVTLPEHAEVTAETTLTYGEAYEYSDGDEYVYSDGTMYIYSAGDESVYSDVNKYIYSDVDEEYTIIKEGEATQIDQE